MLFIRRPVSVRLLRVFVSKAGLDETNDGLDMKRVGILYLDTGPLQVSFGCVDQIGNLIIEGGAADPERRFHFALSS